MSAPKEASNQRRAVVQKGQWDCGGSLGPKRGQEENRMYSQEQRKLAIETFVKFDHSYADTIAELGYPTRAALRIWWNEYEYLRA